MQAKLYGPAFTVLDLTLTLDTVQYADGDLMTDAVELANFYRVPGGSAEIVSVGVWDDDDQGAAFDIIFLNASTALGTVNNAVAFTDAQGRTVVGRVMVPAASYYDTGGGRFAMVTNNTSTGNLPQIVKAAAASTSIYVATISRGTGTYTAAGMRLKIGVVQE